MGDNTCFFNWKFGCDKSGKFIVAGATRIRNIIKHSKIYCDDIHYSLQEKLENDPELTVSCHKTCVSTYTSSQQVKRFYKRKRTQETSSYIPPKTRKKSLDSITFNFLDHCLFCSQTCAVEKDRKNPKRWRPAYQCRRIDSSGQKSMKELILEACTVRNDDWAEQVRIRVEGTISDLHAAGARYHVNCKAHFLASSSVTCTSGKSIKNELDDSALEYVIDVMSKDLSQLWNSVELYQVYSYNGGNVLSRKTLLRKLLEFFGDDLVVLHSAGLANVVCFRSRAAKFLRMVDEDDDDIDVMLSRISKRVVDEIKEIVIDKNQYSTTINTEMALEAVSKTLMMLLETISSKLQRTLPAILIGSIVTGVINNQPTALQTTLGSKMGRSKKLINTLESFGVTCSYDEVLRFKRSSAQAAAKELSCPGIAEASDGLIQVVVDNFDAEISSQNGKLSTHSLAVLVTQPETKTDADQCRPDTIQRITKEEMSEPIEYDISVQRYNGPKKPKMPQAAAVKFVLPLRLLAQQVVSRQRAEEVDFAFMQDVVHQPNCPEYNGYNTSLARNQGRSPQPKTKTVYLPLIDLVPSHPDTIMTAMTEAQQLTHRIGQKFVLFTCDLQLYKVALDVKWAYPDKFSDVIPRLGGMHSLMSFVGCIGTLMENSGLAEILGEVFGGVSKMLTGKKFPQNMRALRMLAEEILREVLDDHPLHSKEDLMKVLGELAERSKTAKLWVDTLIKPVFIIMMFVRAEREGDWLLHLDAFKKMIPYFFAAQHIHYARYSMCYIRSMETLPEQVLSRFMKGEHVMRHQHGLWNGMWSDMFIETTFMRYGHAPAGIIGITLKPKTLKVWAFSLHACSRLEADLDDMIEKTFEAVDKHKEEGKARIGNDQRDREAIREQLAKCINPLTPEKHPENLMNIVTGEHASSKVNVEDAVQIGLNQMREFSKRLPEGLHDPINKKVITMVEIKRRVTVDNAKVYDTNTIYSRVIGLQASGREVNIKDVLSYELAPVPMSMFESTGEMRAATSKSSLKRQLQVEVSTKTSNNVTISIIDGSALLWVICWPMDGTVKDYAMNLKYTIANRLKMGDVHLIFDRYYDYSTKGVTRSARATGAGRVHQLQLNSKLPPQKIVLTVTENKKQLIGLVVNFLKRDTSLHEQTHTHKLVLIGEEAAPIEISDGGVVGARTDLANTHEEADNIIVQQVMMCAQTNEQMAITVVSDDTDVFVLLVHYYHKTNMKNHVTMESPIKDRTIIDIGKTVERHAPFVTEILPAHALTGCDTVACCYGIGKGTALKVLRTGLHSLSLLGVMDAPKESVIMQATAFMSACYGQSSSKSMSETRWKVWAFKTGQASSTPPKLCCLPPTTEAFEENVKRAHYQAIEWRTLEDINPPKLNPELYGWTRNTTLRRLQPTSLPVKMNLAPEFIMHLIRCRCKSGTPCSTRACSCTRDNLSCTIFCTCSNKGCCQRVAIEP